MDSYPNISKERALESINTVILYIRQLGVGWNTLRYRTKAEEIEHFIEESKIREVKK